jgi:transcription elongation factor GreA
MNQEDVILTREGFKKLEDELEELKTVKRKEVAERIKQAISFGDLSENSEYEDAKNEQAFIEGRIALLEQKLRKAQVVVEDNNNETVKIGKKVVVKDLVHNKKNEYTLVGSMEADPDQKRISNVSPVGKALLGKHKGETVEVNTPAGTVKYEVVDII